LLDEAIRWDKIQEPAGVVTFLVELWMTDFSVMLRAGCAIDLQALTYPPAIMRVLPNAEWARWGYGFADRVNYCPVTLPGF
jgi:hypothetical protein